MTVEKNLNKRKRSFLGDIKLGASSQKVNMLGGVAQTLIYPRPSTSLADVGLFVRTMLNSPLSNKKSQPLSDLPVVPAEEEVSPHPLAVSLCPTGQ